MVEFPSLNETLRGKLYLPDRSEVPTPIVIMAHGFSATIDGMVAERYAQVFVDAGFTVLLYDHYSFGISDGTPRRQINRWLQARGYRDAISFVMSLPDIDPDRIALWGDSMSASEVIVVGAIDERVRAVVAQVPACGREPAPSDPDGLLYEATRELLYNENLANVPKKIADPMPVVSHDQLGTPSLLLPITAFHWFIEYGARFGTNWENQASRVELSTSVPFHAGICAPHLHVPVQMLIAHNDEMPGANPQVAYQVYHAIPEPKMLVELEGGHFGLVYYPSEYFDRSSHAQREFLVAHL